MNSSTETYFSVDYWFDKFGYPKYVDIISTFIILPTGLISFALNLLTFMVLRKECFLKSLFFRYMRVYIINGAILSIICSTVFILLAQRMFSFTNTYDGMAYNYIFTLLQPIFFLFSCFLEIFILIERSMYFLPKRFRKMQNINFNKLILFLFLFCVILHIPTFFFFIPAYEDVHLDRNTMFRIWYMAVTNFSYTLTGKVLTYLQYLMRDFLPLIMKLILNTMLVYLAKSYVKKLKNEKLANAQHVLNVSIDVNIQNENYISKTHRSQTYKSLIIICIFSIFEHLLYIAPYILYFLNQYSDSNVLYCLTALFITCKQMFNILVLCKFSILFKAELKKFLNIK